jgi:WhiB family transcriptional regulator, redox-sensing transcriptional regulator
VRTVSTALAFSPGAAVPLPRPGAAGDWTLLAECQYTDPDLFHSGDPGQTWHAKRVCAACPVREECLEYALSAGEKWGVWGGTSERQRQRIFAALRRAGKGLAA